MKIGVVKERRPNEKRCAVSPDTIKKFVGLGAEVVVEAGAGEGCSIPDSVLPGGRRQDRAGCAARRWPMPTSC